MQNHIYCHFIEKMVVPVSYADTVRSQNVSLKFKVKKLKP